MDRFKIMFVTQLDEFYFWSHFFGGNHALLSLQTASFIISTLIDFGLSTSIPGKEIPQTMIICNLFFLHTCG